RFDITVASSMVVYIADTELYAVPIEGSTPTKLNDPIIGNNHISRFAVSTDNRTVVYVADQDTNGVDELYSVGIDGTNPTLRYDANRDNTVTPADMLYVVNRIGQTVNGGNVTADVDSDGSITLGDAEQIIRHFGAILD
ncbi:MAG: dockerin type I domain-containing protein, partial [Chloroflexota bacterium]